MTERNRLGKSLGLSETFLPLKIGARGNRQLFPAPFASPASPRREAFGIEVP